MIDPKVKAMIFWELRRCQRQLPGIIASAFCAIIVSGSLLIEWRYQSLPSRILAVQDLQDLPPLFWSREDLLVCVNERCLRNEAFRNHNLSSEDAELSLGHMRQLLEKKSFFPPVIPQKFLDKLSNSTCAVVGGSPLPPQISATEQSRLVDESADVVFRLNVRVPEFLIAEDALPPLGTRTDAIFVQRGSIRSFDRYIYGWSEGNATRGRLRKQAAQMLKKKWHPKIIFRHECPGRFKSCPKAWDALSSSSLFDWSDMHVLHYHFEMYTKELLQDVRKGGVSFVGSSVPTTGIVAVVTALQICKAVNVFMFNGSITGDGNLPTNDVWRGHNVKSERALLRWLATCSRKEAGICGKLTIFS